MALLGARAPLRTPLGRAIGLGSAKEGVEHWWRERITAIALVPLCLWFVAEIIHHAGADRVELIAWLKHPVPAVLLLLLLATTFHHTALGLQVVIEDYVGHEGARLGLIIAIRLLCVLLAVLGIFAVFRLAFGA
ncbi:MAG TPA: succinate dehydrogenase, hydrophobic membrane anchor protein [Stellaceae bacterium]|jgi:succinate dehydrogenase / fumarate reductase membrane anchor subunit|nr:succinate dehydrogenase, hydrophobic membrane anchor protein [Stellaceae bacterium]